MNYTNDIMNLVKKKKKNLSKAKKLMNKYYE